MSLKNVTDRFLMLSGLGESDLKRWTPLCRDSLEYIESRLKNKDNSNENVCRISSAAAALAYYSYCLTTGTSGDPKRFKAGDIEIEQDYSQLTESAKSLWLCEKEKISDLLKEEGFYFGRIIT
ncbi:MAG: hypothetical protein UIM27_04825 [Acutalibacteraceae bacterium]|nr:hypothetical protein [Acutalibacteraceae bacterium]